MFSNVNDAEKWTIGAEDQRRVDAFHMCACRRMIKISWVEKKANEIILTKNLV